ncbi:MULTISPECIES: Crp/Fnr family transcriptional regulator [unclassified Variovorax]|uniref:Crp/Fnr family transcriptional regulator n=1 Tax=unclassified Variovorax TaxID=663243 RepID=UPI001F0C41DE|nr:MULTISPECIES: Crp/Fnr family transcriptional regulator [unclassified Variovorax]
MPDADAFDPVRGRFASPTVTLALTASTKRSRPSRETCDVVDAALQNIAMHAFHANPWFKTLPDSVADALLNAAVPMRLPCGTFLFSQGDAMSTESAAFFGVVSGLLKLSIFDEAGTEAILATVEPGNWFGGVSTLDLQPRAHCAIALEDSQVLGVRVDQFDVLMQDGAFARAMLRLVASRLRLAYVSLANAALLGTRERLARRIALLACGDMSQSESARSSVSASQETLAMMLGVSRPTLSKELQALAKAGAIRLNYGRIDILDMALLLRDQ